MRIAVIGSRSFSDSHRLALELERYRPDMDQLVSGGAPGADQLAEDWAERHGIATRVFHPDRSGNKRAYRRRNRLIAENCDLLIAFWDGRSTGTQYTIEYARSLGRTVVVIES